MSDADDQMGGQGGETGRAPGEGDPAPQDRGSGGEEPEESEQPDEDAGHSGHVDRYGEDSFPASDPPGTP